MSGKPIQAVIKRLMDVVLAAVALVVLSPALLATTLGVIASTGRPVLFRQHRPGRDGRLFTLNKFRTMRDPIPGEVWFRSDAKRLTATGRFLRKTSIDELPELWNVLLGDMSLVGPRPLLKEYLPKYTPQEARRHEVRPGITGWAQVNGRQNIPFSQRLALDVWYVDHWSVSLDLRILVMTVVQLLRPSGVVSGQQVDDVDDLGLSEDRERRPRVPEDHG